MNEFKEIAAVILANSSNVDWLIAHKLSSSSSQSDEISYLNIDGLEGHDLPFSTNQGYLSIKNKIAYDKYKKVFRDLSSAFSSDIISLANIFILITRIDVDPDFQETHIEEYIEITGKDKCKKVYDVLIQSLNTEYYAQRPGLNNMPPNITEWLQLFSAAQYVHPIADPLLSIMPLINDGIGNIIDYNDVVKMNSFLRSVLIEHHGYKINFSSPILPKYERNLDELTFISACLINGHSFNRISPDWLGQDLVDLFIDTYWNEIGTELSALVYGLTYRKIMNRDVNQRLEVLIDDNYNKKFQTDGAQLHSFIKNLSFPDDYITVFSWCSQKQKDCLSISAATKEAIINQFNAELLRIFSELPESLARQDFNDPFQSNQLTHSKYQNALAYILLLMLEMPQSIYKNIQGTCFKYKMLLYGSYKIKSIGMHFAEIMLLIGLSRHKNPGIIESKIEQYNSYIKILLSTILTPYIHLSERENVVWDADSEQWRIGLYAGTWEINEILKNHEIYNELKNELENIKISRWPYERVSS